MQTEEGFLCTALRAKACSISRPSSVRCKRSKAEYYLVEQDNAAEKPDPFAEVGISAQYLKRSEVW